jgi:hypothetical protein
MEEKNKESFSKRLLGVFDKFDLILLIMTPLTIICIDKILVPYFGEVGKYFGFTWLALLFIVYIKIQVLTSSLKIIDDMIKSFEDVDKIINDTLGNVKKFQDEVVDNVNAIINKTNGEINKVMDEKIGIINNYLDNSQKKINALLDSNLNIINSNLDKIRDENLEKVNQLMATKQTELENDMHDLIEYEIKKAVGKIKIF